MLHENPGEELCVPLFVPEEGFAPSFAAAVRFGREEVCDCPSPLGRLPVPRVFLSALVCIQSKYFLHYH